MALTSTDTKTKDVEHQQPVEPTDIGEFSKLKVEEHDQSFNTPENSFQNKSGRKETYSEVHLGFMLCTL